MKNKSKLLSILALASFVLAGCDQIPLIGNLFKGKDDQQQQQQGNDDNEHNHSHDDNDDEGGDDSGSEDDGGEVDAPIYIETIAPYIKTKTYNKTSYKQPYFLKLDEGTIDLSVKIEKPNATLVAQIDADKKTFSWVNQNEDIVDLTLVESEKTPTLEAKATPKKVGTAVIEATNTYDSSLKATFVLKVIDVKSTDYLWRFGEVKQYYCFECQKYYRSSEMNKSTCPCGHKLNANFKESEANQFNNCEYQVNETSSGQSLVLAKDAEGKEKPHPGLPSGHAYLGEQDWYFERSRSDTTKTELNVAASSDNSLTFGKGTDIKTFENGAENLYLKTTTTKKIKRVSVETASNRGLADFKIKVAGQEKLSQKASYLYDTVRKGEFWSDYNWYSVEIDGDISGDIEFLWQNAVYDADAYFADPDNYKSPGAIKLKTILIEYKD